MRLLLVTALVGMTAASASYVRPAVYESPQAQHASVGFAECTIRVVDPEGVPLPKVALALRRKPDVIRAQTGVDGIATASVKLHGDKVRVMLTPAAPAGASRAEWVRWQERFEALTKEYGFRRRYEFQVDPDGRCEGEIVGEPAVSINGTMIGAEGVPIAKNEGWVLNPDSPAPMSRAKPGGRVQIHGVPKGRPICLYFSFSDAGTLIIRKTLASEQTSADVELGSIEHPKPIRSASVDIAVVGDTSRDTLQRYEATGSGITLIPVDAHGCIYSFILGRRGTITRAIIAHNNPTLPAVAPGSYYLVTGVFLTTPSQLKVIELARRNPDVIDERIPHIVAKAGEVASIDFDAARAAEGVFNIDMDDNDRVHSDD